MPVETTEVGNEIALDEIVKALRGVVEPISPVTVTAPPLLIVRAVVDPKREFTVPLIVIPVVPGIARLIDPLDPLGAGLLLAIVPQENVESIIFESEIF